MLADHDEQHRYGDATILEPIVEQQDEEVRDQRDSPFTLLAARLDLSFAEHSPLSRRRNRTFRSLGKRIRLGSARHPSAVRPDDRAEERAVLSSSSE